MTKKRKAIVFAFLLFFPLAEVFAMGKQTLYSTIRDLVFRLTDLIFLFAAFLIVVASYNFLIARGDTNKIEEAREQIVYALIAMGLAAISWTLSKWLAHQLNVPTSF